MEYNLETIRMQTACSKLASELMPRFSPVVAHDMTRLWNEHLSERAKVSRVLEGWADTLTVTNETESVFRQIFIRLLGVAYLMSEYLEGRSDCTFFETLQGASSHFRHLAIEEWSTDHWPQEWFRVLGTRQMNIHPE